MRKVLAASTWERKISHERSISTSLLGKLFEGRWGEHETAARVCVSRCDGEVIMKTAQHQQEVCDEAINFFLFPRSTPKAEF